MVATMHHNQGEWGGEKSSSLVKNQTTVQNINIKKKNSITHPYFNLLYKISNANLNMNTLNIDKYTFWIIKKVF